MLSAFGVEHPTISKAARKQTNTKPASGGRIVAGSLVPFGLHGAVAGKPGHKLRAWGNEFGGDIAGSIIGGATRHPMGSLVGSVAGGAAGTVHAQRRGHYKKQ